MIDFAWMRRLLASCLLLFAGQAFATDQCPTLAQRQSDPQVATRIAAIACDEHLRWNRPFIDADGRLASLNAYEAEANGLKDGGSPWRRVAFYSRSWRIGRRCVAPAPRPTAPRRSSR